MLIHVMASRVTMHSHTDFCTSVCTAAVVRAVELSWFDMMPCDCSYIADTSGESEDAPVKRGLPLGADSSGNLYFHLGSDLGKVPVFSILRPVSDCKRVPSLLASLANVLTMLTHRCFLVLSATNWELDPVYSSTGGGNIIMQAAHSCLWRRPTGEAGASTAEMSFMR